ncbi:helix-turn-helix domain-containing protein [Chryseolinea sp. H1M3-3]|uniref:helix-turn-helix domain-containing protein n=1 Tax=Chryseolinea sp. H1M3-3 TaxID=3034144 RepID=UPI0023EB5323|nr:helix-turn-helix domain-containing protein [Chryseolinea sp. H1M3-3]
MLYKSFLPGPALHEFVRNYTLIHFQFNNHEPIPRKQRSPKPEEKLVFYIQGGIKLSNLKTGCTEKPPVISIFSHQLDPRILQVTPTFFAFIVFFRPGVLHRLIHLPVSEMFDQFCDAELFFGSDISVVREQLAEAAGHASMISIVERFLFSKCRSMKERNPVDDIANYLLADPTGFSLDALADQACLSTKQFYRRFKERIGTSPKLFSRLSRFNHAYRYKIVYPDVPWSSIAQQFQYTDYHHLEKEFKEFAGQTPKEWVDTHMASPERILKLR